VAPSISNALTESRHRRDQDLVLCSTEQRQRRQREEQHRQEAGCDKRCVDDGTEQIELYTDLARDDQEAERGCL